MISLVRFIIVSNNVWQWRMMPDAIYMMEASVEFGGWRARIFRHWYHFCTSVRHIREQKRT
jgi:hypothetical protein